MLNVTHIMLDNALLTREEMGKTSSIELKHQKVEHKDIEKQILSNTDLVQIQILQYNLSVINLHIETLSSYLHDSKLLVESLKKKIKRLKDNIAKLHKERGWNVDSVLVSIERILKTFNIEVEAYHGGQFNGVSSRKILNNIEKNHEGNKRGGEKWKETTKPYFRHRSTYEN